MATASSGTEVSTKSGAKSAGQSVGTKVAVAMSIVALIVSGLSLAGWAQASGERNHLETRLACLELPGPNDCGQDDR